MASTPLFDDFGRCIPANLQAEVHTKTRRYFAFDQPAIDYNAIHGRLQQHLPIQCVSVQGVSAEQFAQRAEKILAQLSENPQTSNILKGVHVPFILPKQSETADIGKTLEQHYLPAVKDAFEATYPENSFTNHVKDSLSGRLTIAPDSRHQQLMQAQQNDFVVGYYFPCLMEYSVPAAIEQMQYLPPTFLMAGAFDTAAAFVGSPDLLLRKNGYPPVIWLGALAGEKPEVGYHFEAYGYNLTFNRKPHFGKVAESWASGLVVLG